MAQDRGGAGEEFDLDLKWPHDTMRGPLVPAAPRAGASAAVDLQDDGEIGDDEAAEAAVVPEVSPADRRRQAFVQTLNPSMSELVADFESFVSTTSTFGHIVEGHFRGYLEEVALMETVSTGYLKRYRDGHLRALTQLRHLVGDSPEWAQWLADSIREMATAVDGAVESIRDLGEEARATATRNSESVTHMTDAVRWLGERLQSNLAELSKVVQPEPGDGETAVEPALSDGEAAIQRALARLSEGAGDDAAAQSRVLVGDREVGAASVDRLLLAHSRLEKEVGRLVDELQGGGSGEVLVAVERLADELRESGPESVRAEVARLAEEMQAMRRRLNLRARTPVTLEDDQVEAIARALADSLSGGEPSEASSRATSTRRRPLEAPGRATRRTTRG